jgi:hypothetical protein
MVYVAIIVILHQLHFIERCIDYSLRLLIRSFELYAVPIDCHIFAENRFLTKIRNYRSIYMHEAEQAAVAAADSDDS